MPAWGLGAVVLAAAVLCGLLSGGEPLQTGAASTEYRPQVEQEETRPGRPEKRPPAPGETRPDQETPPAPEETRDGPGDQSETRPACLVSKRDGAVDAGADSTLSGTVYRSLRLKRTPLRISRIGEYRPGGAETAPIGGTDRYPPEDVGSAEGIRLERHQSNEERPAGTSFTQLQKSGPVWKSSFLESSGTYHQHITHELPWLGGIESRLENRPAPEVSGTEPATQSDSETEYWSGIGPQPDRNNGNRAADVPAASDSSELTERLQAISSRIQLVRQKLSRRLSSEMRSSGGGNSLVTLAILALGVLLFDAINDALADGGGGGRDADGGLWDRLLVPELWRWAAAPDRWDRLLAELSAEEASVGREVLLPGPGLIGEYVNSLLEIGLNMITVWMYGGADSQCGRRLLCELNQKARSQSPLHSVLTYAGGLLLSLLLPEASTSEHLLAMRQGRRGADCLAAFDRCQVTL